AVFTGDQKLRKLEQREQALYKTWLDLLSAKTELEKLRKVRIEYDAMDASGPFLRLGLAQGSTDGTALLDRDVAISTSSQEAFKGTVVSCDGGILIRPSEWNKVPVDLILDQGFVETDTTRSDVALDKQKAAVEAVRYGRSVNPDLGRLITNPEQIEVPARAHVDFIQKSIDADKQDAVLTAISSPSLMLV